MHSEDLSSIYRRSPNSHDANVTRVNERKIASDFRLLSAISRKLSASENHVVYSQH